MSAPAIILGTVGLNLLARSPGVVARVGADWDADEKTRNQTLKREALHLLGSVAFSAAAVPVSRRLAPALFSRSAFLAKIDKEVAQTAVATGLGATLTEIVSRAIAPVRHDKPDAERSSFHDDDDHDEPRTLARLIANKLDIVSEASDKIKMQLPPTFSRGAVSSVANPFANVYSAPASTGFNSSNTFAQAVSLASTGFNRYV